LYCSNYCKNKYHRENKGKEYFIICKNCGKNFVARTQKKIFCYDQCRVDYFIKNPIKHDYTLICNNCGKEFYKTLANKPNPKENHYCSQECVSLHKNRIGIGIKLNCKNCGKEFYQTNNRHYFCCNKCKGKYGSDNAPTKEVFCSNCGKSIQRIRSLQRNNFFCSRECESNFRENEANDIRICKCCEKEFKCKKGDKLIFCSKKCQIIGLSKKPTIPHQIIIELLESLFLNFEIEYPIKRYSIDNYLLDLNLAIEVMGSYWHSDVRLYKNPESKRQVSDIKKDKKRSKELKTLNVPVLYLWECDILNSLLLCRELILYFVEKNGILDNYHSMNYHLNGDTIVKNEEILIPYFEKENDYISPLTTGTRELHFLMEMEQSEHTS
jgi:G:T-mismatch repair DNA endonuclease (very short patch repair protein)